MYINFWYAMEESRFVTQEKPARVKVLGQQFVLFRDQSGQVHCLHDVCSHRGGALSKGKIKGDCVECPYHGWQFNGAGDCTYIPSQGKNNQKVPPRSRIDSYPVHEEVGLIFAFLGDLPEEERPPLHVPSLNAKEIDYSGADGVEWRSVAQSWQIRANYERCVENGIDPAHNEFVHAAHGFGGQYSDNYKINDLDMFYHPWGQGFIHWFDDAPDSVSEVLYKAGAAAKRSGRQAGAGHSGPNAIWTHIHITPENKLHQFLYETPVDKHNTRAFNVQMSNFIPVEAAEDDEIREMAAAVAEEDVAVLEDLYPPCTPDDLTSEVMMPHDKPVVEYRGFLKQWTERGWRIDVDAIERAQRDDNKCFAIPSPRRRTEKGWVFDPVPLVTPAK